MVAKKRGKILIVDDEWESDILMPVKRTLAQEGWRPIIIQPQAQRRSPIEFQDSTLNAIEKDAPGWVFWRP